MVNNQKAKNDEAQGAHETAQLLVSVVRHVCECLAELCWRGRSWLCRAAARCQGMV